MVQYGMSKFRSITACFASIPLTPGHASEPVAPALVASVLAVQLPSVLLPPAGQLLAVVPPPQPVAVQQLAAPLVAVPLLLHYRPGTLLPVRFRRGNGRNQVEITSNLVKLLREVM